MYSRRRKGRLREIEIERLERIKDGLQLSWTDISRMLGITTTQLSRYRATACLPADRFYAFRDAMLLRTEERARQEREQILSLFTSQQQTSIEIDYNNSSDNEDLIIV